MVPLNANETWYIVSTQYLHCVAVDMNTWSLIEAAGQKVTK